MIKEIHEIPGLEIINPKKISQGAFDGMVLVGSSCSGKTTLIREIANARLPQAIVPERLTTRMARPDDNLSENRAISDTEFQEYVDNNKMYFHWVKPETNARYGFLRFEQQGSFPIYSGNNAFLRSESNLKPINALGKILVVGISASRKDRKKRILFRSPDLPQAEIDLRLNDSMDDIIHNVDILIYNPANDQATSKTAVRRFTEIVTNSFFKNT